MVAAHQNIACVQEVVLMWKNVVQREHYFVWKLKRVYLNVITDLNAVKRKLQNPLQNYQQLQLLQQHQLPLSHQLIVPFCVLMWIVELQGTAVTHYIVTAAATVW